jgi:hypothetical protein
LELEAGSGLSPAAPVYALEREPDTSFLDFGSCRNRIAASLVFGSGSDPLHFVGQNMEF